MFRLLFVGLLIGLWLSLEDAHCEILDKDVTTMTLCYNTSSGKTCFTTFIANDSHLVRKPLEAARHLCNSTVSGSSLIRINRLEGQRAAEIFIGSHELKNETIIIDAQRLSAAHSLEWSWVNGHPTVPKDFSKETTLLDIDAACVESKSGQSLIYYASTQRSRNRYICEYSDSNSNYSYQHNKSHYIASEESTTWNDARNECLQSGGDLASITDLSMIENWSLMKKPEKYWIGLHRKKWIWNSTGAALTYTNWKGGYPDEASSVNKCICMDPQCRKKNNETICDNDRKWSLCNCDNDYVIICQKEESFDTSTSESVVAEVTHQSIITTGEPEISISPSASAISTSTKISIAVTSIITTTSTKPSTASTSIPTTPSTKPGKPSTASTLIPTTPSTKPSITSTPVTKTSSSKTTTPTTKVETNGTSFTKPAIAPVPSGSTATTEIPSTGLSFFQSFGKKEILIAVLLLVTVVFIIGAVILFIRKRKRDKRNATSPTDNTKQDETVTSEYATVVPGNKPPEVTTPAASPTYAEVVKTQQPKPSSNPNAEVTPNPTPSNTTYAEVQMTQNPKPSSTPNAEVTPNPTPSNITYAEVQMTQQPAPSNTTYAEVQMTQQPGPSNTTYAEVTQRPTPSDNTYAEVVMTQQPAPSDNHIYANFQPTTTEAADMSSSVVYAGLDFSHPNGKAVDEPIYLQAMDVKPEAVSGEEDVAAQDLSPVYAESMKLKKSD